VTNFIQPSLLIAALDVVGHESGGAILCYFLVGDVVWEVGGGGSGDWDVLRPLIEDMIDAVELNPVD